MTIDRCNYSQLRAQSINMLDAMCEPAMNAIACKCSIWSSLLEPPSVHRHVSVR